MTHPRGLLLRSGLRFLVRRPWQSALAVLGIAVGVGAVAGIDLANASALRAMDLSVESVSRGADHKITGGPAGIDESWYVAARRDPIPGVTLAPVIRGRVQSAARGRSIDVLGIDPFAPSGGIAGSKHGSNRVTDARLDFGAIDFGAWLSTPGGAILGDALATRLGVEIGDDVAVVGPQGPMNLRVLGRIRTGDARRDQAFDNTAWVDIGTAQVVLAKAGRLDAIEVIAADDTALSSLAARLPPGARLAETSNRSAMLGEITEAFRLNLMALSLLALLVGAFLIYNTMSFAVVQRRAWIGLMRALGASRRRVAGLVIAEALVLGVVGTVLGLVFGIVLARGLISLVVGTINDLYFALEVQRVAWLATPLAKSALLGLGTSVLAAAVPAIEAASAPPRRAQLRSASERRARSGVRIAAGIGVVLLMIAAVLVVLVPRGLGVGFLSVFLAVAGAACLVPLATVGLLRSTTPLLRRAFGSLGALAGRGVIATLSRTGVALAALVVAVATATGVGIMVHSFRATLVDWLEVTLQADVYVTALEDARGARPPLEPDVVRRLAATPGAETVVTYRHIKAASAEGPLDLTALDMPFAGFRIFRLTAGSPRGVYDALFDDALFDDDGARTESTSRTIMISTPLAYRLDRDLGDAITLETDRGTHDFTVVGIYDDFATDRGVVTMARATYDAHYDDRAIQSLGIFAAPGIDSETLRTRLETALDASDQVGGEAPGVQLLPNAAIRSLSLEIFDRTFRVTSVLRLLAVMIAFIGVFSALMALELERGRERATLRVLGVEPRQLTRLIHGQTALMGVTAGLLAVPLSVLLAWLLVHVINRRAFGWVLRLDIPPTLLVQGVVLAALAALLAGLWPAYRMARIAPARGIREE